MNCPQDTSLADEHIGLHTSGLNLGLVGVAEVLLGLPWGREAGLMTSGRSFQLSL